MVGQGDQTLDRAIHADQHSRPTRIFQLPQPRLKLRRQRQILEHRAVADRHAPAIDFAGHARSLGAAAEQVKSIADLEAALARAKRADRTTVVVIETDPATPTQAGGAWWDVPVPEVSARPEVTAARHAYDVARRRQRTGG